MNQSSYKQRSPRIAFNAKNIRHIECSLSLSIPLWAIFEKYDHRSLNMPQHVRYVYAYRLCPHKDLCDRAEIDLYAVEGSAARERANKRPDAMSTTETKITSAINDVIDFADCCISTWNRLSWGYNACAHAHISLGVIYWLFAQNAAWREKK